MFTALVTLMGFVLGWVVGFTRKPEAIHDWLQRKVGSKL